MIFGGGAIKSGSLTIYNRWGEKVFETYDITIAWDGKRRNVLCNSGVFTYVLLGQCTVDGSEVYQKGNISLVR